MPDYRYESRECNLCHRVGYRGFVAFGDWAWVLRERPCMRGAPRASWPRRREREPALTDDGPIDLSALGCAMDPGAFIAIRTWSCCGVLTT